MKVIFAFAALCLSGVSADLNLRMVERQLEDVNITEVVCGICSGCDFLGDLCDPATIQAQACTQCDIFGQEACDGCAACDDNSDLCDPNELYNIICEPCPEQDFVSVVIDAAGTFGLCFSEVSTVQVMGTDGATTTTAMKDLKIGDSVLTKEGTYEQVYAFGHHHPTKQASFFQIHSENVEQPLEVTGDHLIFKLGSASPVPAQTLQVGDKLVTANGEESSITQIGQISRQGIYAPITMGGTLLVDGVAASSYINLKGDKTLFADHDLVHLTLSPLRMVCNGVSSAFCDTRFYMDNGMPVYAHYGMELLNFLLQSNVVVKTLGMAPILLVSGTSQLLENTYGASFAPLVILLAAMVYRMKSKAKSV